LGESVEVVAMTPTDATRPADGLAPDAGHTETPGAREGLRGLLGERSLAGQCYCSKKDLKKLGRTSWIDFDAFERAIAENQKTVDSFLIPGWNEDGVVSYTPYLGDDGINFSYIGCAFSGGCEALIANKWAVTRKSGGYFDTYGLGFCLKHIPAGQKGN